MRQIEKDIKGCKRCDLWKTRTNPVVGEGAPSASVFFVGEAPGYNEDLEGKPFVGKAGKVLDELLESIGWQRADVYIANVLKCRPPGNRDPLTGEILACTTFLDAQLELIEPAVIATLGNFSLYYIFAKFHLKPDKIGAIHGNVFTVSTIAGIKRIIPLYHPAVAVYNPRMKEVLIADFKVLAETIKEES